VVNVYKKSTSLSNLIVSDTVYTTTKIDSIYSYTNKFTIPYFRDSMKIFLELKTKSPDNEIHSYYNLASLSLNLLHHSPGSSSIQVFSDGQLLNSGDFVRQNAEFKITLDNQSENTVPLSDTTQLKVNLNGIYVPYFVNGTYNSMLKAQESDEINLQDENSHSVFFYPVLENGNNRLSIFFKTTDDNVDSVLYDVIVSNELAVKDLYNYPNPVRNETNFIFNLAGSSAPDKFKIKIYTVSGKLIKEINYPVQIGFNQVPWDGRDSDGDLLANGTYIYKLVAEDETKSESMTEKLVILR
jgi:hypothetical protein